MPSDYHAITQHNERQLGLDTASRKAQICMYSDSTHFIYEILQNADDYGATEVAFILGQNALTIEHNGELFAEENVKAITYFGKSTSREDLVKTGRFGVGFKSVFAFTATPVILSGDERFVIHGLYRVSEHLRTEDLPRHRTRIVLPFNHVTERPDYVEDLMHQGEAYGKIAKRLSELNMSTLLFTRNIREVRWQTEDRSGHYLREDSQRKGARFTSITDGSVLNRYLVFARVPIWHGQQHKAVEIAFALDAKEQITAADDFLYVLFATTQETHLQFLLNGPYRTNPSRETISEDDPFNVHLMGETCSLLQASLPLIREAGLLTTGFLSVLANPEDKLRPFFKPLLAALHESFQTTDLVPTDSGKYAASNSVVQGPSIIREVVTNDELPFLAGKSVCDWVKGVQSGTRADLFLRGLGIKTWGFAELEAVMAKKFPPCYPPVQRRDEEWLAHRQDTWMQRLYILLGEAIRKRECSEQVLGRCRIVRVMEGREEKHVVGSVAYFPKGKGFSDLTQVKRTILKTRSDQQGKSIESALLALGVKQIGDEERVDLILEAYYGDDHPNVSEAQHIAHMRTFIRSWTKDKNPGSLTWHSIFRPADEEDCKMGAQCYIDAPVRASELSCIYRRPPRGVEPRHPVWPGYKQLVGEGFCEFAAACGVADHLAIKHRSTHWHPRAKDLRKGAGATRRSDYTKDDDYTIPDLRALLSLKDLRVNALIWTVMCKADPDVLEARYRPNSLYETRTQKSSLVLDLANTAWIPDRRRVFHKPAEMTKDRLHSEFRFDNRNGWLDEIGFGEGQKLADEGYQKQREMAKALGLPPEAVDLINSRPPAQRPAMMKRVMQALREEVAAAKRAERQQRSTPSFRQGLASAFTRNGVPGEQSETVAAGTSRNPTRRMERLAAELADTMRGEPSPEGRFAFRLRKTWKGKNDKVKVAMLHWYSGRCQICGKTFVQRNGQPYFEGLYLVPYTQAEWLDRPGNVVCLCPWHSAMFQFGSKEFAGDITHTIEGFTPKALGGTSDPLLKFTLCGEDVTLSFAEDHFLELKVMMDESVKPVGG